MELLLNDVKYLSEHARLVHPYFNLQSLNFRYGLNLGICSFSWY